MQIENYNTQELVRKYNFKFSKSLGQNFLIDDSVLDDIVVGADVNEEDYIIDTEYTYNLDDIVGVIAITAVQVGNNN